MFKFIKIVFWISSIVLLSACGGGGGDAPIVTPSDANNTDTTAPVFTSSDRATVAENQLSAITLVATDTNTITYSISGTDASSFDVNSSSGVVTFNTAPDFETKTSYTFTASATDSLSNISTQDINITISDVDEIAPSFTSTSSATATVDENQLSAIKLRATDTNGVTYSISGTDASSFSVDGSSGVVTFNTAPDFETKTSYTFTASATDSLSNVSTQNVTITISNIVEQVAVLTGNQSITTSEKTPANSNVGTIGINSVTDSDITSFSIQGDGSSNFSIATDGTISLVNKLDYEVKSNYILQIKATNPVGTSNEITLTITVTDINDLAISLALYDNNQTSTLEDDRLYISYNIGIASASIISQVDLDYNIYGVGAIGSNAVGSYNSSYFIHSLDLSVDASLPSLDSNISIKPDTITDIAGNPTDIVKSRIYFKGMIKKSDQNVSYEENGTINSNGSIKDDGYYQKGDPSHYTRDNDKDIVIDHLTRLMWQDDTNTTKFWITQVNFDNGNFSNTTGETATFYCNTLSLGGFDDWRLPTIDELMSISDKSKASPAIDKQYFKNIVNGEYWSSNTLLSDINKAMTVHFDTGEGTYSRKNNILSTRCVRVIVL